MRKVFSVVAAAAFILGLSCLVYAADAGGYTVKGKVVSVDPAGKTVVVSTTEGEKTVVFQEGVAGFTEMKVGASVEMTCIDQEGKSCAKDVKVISAEAAGKPTKTFEGEVVSIDPEGKSVVIKSPKGEQMTIQVMTPTVEKEMKAPTGEMKTETMPAKELKPGMQIKADCFDSEGKFCANKITVVSPEAAGKPVEGMEVVGEVTSIDSTGKSVVIKTVTGPKTVYYQPSSTGAALGDLEVGKRVKAYCLDIEGKSCIKDIAVTPVETPAAAPAAQ